MNGFKTTTPPLDWENFVQNIEEEEPSSSTSGHHENPFEDFENE